MRRDYEAKSERCQRRLKASTLTLTWTWAWGEKHALERAKRAVSLEHLAESDEAAHIAFKADEVVGETMRQKATTVSRVLTVRMCTLVEQRT